MTQRPSNYHERPTVDLTALEPGTLSEIPEDQFRLVVDADVKRLTPNTPEVPEWVTAELRGAALERWHRTLRRMLESVEGQLAAREADYESRKATLNRRRLTGDSSAEVALEELNVRHFQGRSKSLRFRSGLSDVLIEADGLRGSRISQLEKAIREHHGALGDDEENVTDADRRLWAVLDLA